MMRDVLLRRFAHAGKKDSILPDLILVDGGMGQLNVALKVIEELDVDGITVVGIAKGIDRHAGREKFSKKDATFSRFLRMTLSYIFYNGFVMRHIGLPLEHIGQSGQKLLYGRVLTKFPVSGLCEKKPFFIILDQPEVWGQRAFKTSNWYPG